MSLFDQNLNAFRALRPNYTNKRTGKLGKYNDDGSINSDVSYGLTADYSWVRFNEDRAATRVKNLNVRREWGTPVWVEFNELTREDEVTGVHTILAPAVFGGEIAAALNNPGIPASVSTPVSANDVMPGRVVTLSSGGLVVRIWATWTPHGAYWDGSTLITLTPTATSSKRSFACVGIDNTGAAVTTLSTDRALSYAFTDAEGTLSTLGADDIKTVMDSAPGTWWCGAVLLSNGDTSVDPTRIYDLRFWKQPEMTGADGVDAGVAGLVPTPAATDNLKSLRGDGTWVAEATTALDNLASVAINTSLISDTDSTDDLGSTSKFWRNGYIDTLYISEQSAPSTPASGSAVVYAKTDGKVYSKDDAGNEYDLTAGAGGSGYTTVQDEGSSLTARSTINFVGGGVTATDDGSKTVVTIPTGTGDYIMLSDTKTQNTAGGTFTSGAWRTRDLNTENADAGGHCSLSSNEFTLAAGTYRIKVTAPAYFVGSHRARLYNVTDAAVQQDVGSNDMYGTTEYSRAGGVGDHAQTHSFITGRFTLASSKALRVEHRCVTTCASIGFGVASNLAVEVYTTVEIIKE